MKTRLLGLCIGALLAGMTVSAGASADSDQRFAAGERMLAEGNFHAALEAWDAAAQADRANLDLQQQFAVLRQVVQLRDVIKTETDPQRYETITSALRAFYYEHGLYAEALPLDRQRHERGPSAESAAPLAETLLELGRDAEASAALTSFAGPDAPPAARILGGIAFARQGRVDEARAVAAALALPDGTPAQTLFHAARLQALAGDAQAAVALLTRALQATAPSAQAARCSYVRACPDFASLAATPGFAGALETASKVSESKCSQAPSCGGCPRAKACAQAKPPSERTE